MADFVLYVFYGGNKKPQPMGVFASEQAAEATIQRLINTPDNVIDSYYIQEEENPDLGIPRI